MKDKSLFRKMLSLLCMVAILVSSLSTSVYAETAAEKVKRLREELTATRNQISSYKNNISKQKNYLEELKKEKELIDQLVETQKEEIARTEREMDHKQEQVSVYRQAIYENDELLKERLVAIYNMNNASTLSQLLSVDSFTELFTVMDAMQRISEHDTKLLQDLSGQRTQLEAQQAEIDGMLVELDAKYQELLASQEDLVNNIMNTDASITRAQAELAAQVVLEGETSAALEQAQKEMIAIQGRIGGSRKGDGSQFVGGAFRWPVPDSYRITCEFGAPDPNGRGHRGMDIGAPTGTTIVAVGNGTVVEANYAHSSYGQYLVIDHGDGVKSLYAHCSALFVSPGTQVSAGTPIAAVGSTGFSTGPHLHLEVINGGSLDNPRAWLQG